MTRWTASLLFLLTLASALRAQPQPLPFPSSIRFPAPPKAPDPAPIIMPKLTADVLYVIDSDTPITVLASPDGLVSITEEAGSLKVKAKFIDGNGKSETRTYTGKQVFSIEAKGTGTVELIIMPVGSTKATDAIRKTLQVDDGSAPRPPPKPPEPVDNDPYLTALKAAYASETDSGKQLSAQKLAQVYLDSAGKVYGSIIGGFFTGILNPAIKAANLGPLAATQAAIAKEAEKRFPQAAAPLDAPKLSAWCKETGEKLQSIVGQAPPVPAAPVATHLYLLTFDDASTRTQATAQLLGDKAYWNDVIKQGHKFRAIDVKNPAATPWQPFYTKGGVSPPSLVILDADKHAASDPSAYLGTVPLPVDKAAMDSIIKKYTGK